MPRWPRCTGCAAAGLRARLGRSVPLRHRAAACRGDLARGDDRRPGAVGLQPGGGAARLVAARDGARLAARPADRPDPPAPPCRRADPRADLGRDRAAGASPRLLAGSGFGASRLTVLEALGGPRERRRRDDCRRLRYRGHRSAQPRRHRGRRGAGRAHRTRWPGLADELFEHDGQITKREVRAVTLSSLAPRRGELLWDIGAGSGSVAIEWMLADRSLRAIAIEARADRAERIGRNAAALRRAGPRSRTRRRAGSAPRPCPAGRGLHRRRRRRSGRARRRDCGAAARAGGWSSTP